MASAEKPVPVPNEEDRPYWEGARAGKLVLQQCKHCGLYSSQPRVICPRCHSDEFEWNAVSGRGHLHSYTIVRQTTGAGFQDEIPYVVCHVVIDEEPTCYVTGNLLVDESEYEGLAIDLPVVVEFEDRGEAVVPQWRLA